MDEPLFPIEDAYDGDPLRPDLETPTPLEIVARLTRSDRIRRLHYLKRQAHQILTDAMTHHERGRTRLATCVLFSGGNDSTVLAHLMRSRATHAIHAATGIGIPETTQYVRDTCDAWGLPLIVHSPKVTYEDLVLGRSDWPGGFPGPGAHGTMYQRLKERCLDEARHTLGVANSRSEYVIYIGGRRRQESERREDVPLDEADGTVIWSSPLAMWTKADLNMYRLEQEDIDPVPTNPVTVKLHMSGECLCGAFAHPGELEEIRYWYPEFGAYVDDLGAQIRALGIVPDEWSQWGHGLGKPSRSGRLCGSCAARYVSPHDDTLAI